MLLMYEKGMSESLHTFKSESKLWPKLAATDSRPSLPKPSFSSQLMVAAAGSWFWAPTPTAARSDCKELLVKELRRAFLLLLAYC